MENQMANQNAGTVIPMGDKPQQEPPKDVKPEKESFFKKLIHIPAKIHGKISGFVEDHPRLSAGIGTVVGIGMGIGGKMLYDRFMSEDEAVNEDDAIETEFIDDDVAEDPEEPTEEE